MSDLLDETVAAHGGRKRWNDVSNIRTHLRASGALLHIKGQQSVFSEVDVDVDPRTQRAIFTPFARHDWRGIYEPDRVRIEDVAGNTIEERDNPRASFAGHQLHTAWDQLHALYFGGYAMWTYLTIPFMLSAPGVSTSEFEPWVENGKTFRRLRVTFPRTIATHGPEETFYVNEGGLIERHDYTADVIGGGRGAHYLSGHEEFDGIIFPTLRQVYPRGPNNESATEPLMIRLELDSYVLT